VRILDELPEFTRDQFENAEGVYWERKLLNDARHEVLSGARVSSDTIAALEQIGVVVGRNERGQVAYSTAKAELEEKK